VPKEKVPLFMCGAAMFMQDIGETEAATGIVSLMRSDETVKAKWAYLRENRPDFVVRYAPLFNVMARGA
jgi:hypothetical protein